MDDYEYDYEYDDVLYTDVPVVEGMDDVDLQMVYTNCVVPSLASIALNIYDLLIYNILFSIMVQVGTFPKPLFHVLSSMLGLAMLWNVNDPVRLCIFISYLISCYAILRFSHKMCRRVSFSSTTFTMVVLILSLLVCEFCYPYPHVWLQIRGVIMVLVMKVFSLAHDFQYARKMPSFFEYAGYACCPANCLFGPWMPFNEYCAVTTRPFLRNWRWGFRILTCLAIALLFLIISNCWCTYFLTGNNALLKSYRMALTFRTSHYFVSYLSEMGMVLAGFTDDKSQPGKWRYQITDPLKIEFPSSLVSVVTSWNIPMHVFLKKYIYRKILPYGQFRAIIATYFISSLLHGFNIEIAVVLLSIGLFSYIQLRFQDKLSQDFDACVQIRPCQHHCRHKSKRNDTLIILLRILFSILTVIHLAYLGMLMDAIDNPNSPSILEKWESLYYFSHIFIFFSYLHST